MNWQDDLRTAISKVVLSKGHPASDYDESYYASWVYGNYHDEYREILDHAKTCPFTPDGEARAIGWSAFQDTEAPNLHKHGLIVVASCACGRYRDITWLYEKDLGAVLNDLLEVSP